MEKKRISDERLAELIRAAALRREVPVGLETRVMAQVILRDRRRRERRAIAAMACYCAVAVAAVMVVAFVCLRSVDSPEGALQVLAILAGAVAAMVVACGEIIEQPVAPRRTRAPRAMDATRRDFTSPPRTVAGDLQSF